MAQPEYDNTRYLFAKRSVDDRALNRVVLESLRQRLAGLQAPVSILELGAGVGTMALRLANWGLISQARYTLLDRDQRSLEAAADYLSLPTAHRFDRPQVIANGKCRLELELVNSDIEPFLGNAGGGPSYDLVIANALLDLLDVPRLLAGLWKVLGPGRPFWFSINFDGETVFLPELGLDQHVMSLYHASMDNRPRQGLQAGDSKAGRHLLEEIPKSGGTLLSAGSSDWVVWPNQGRYPEDEAYFLHHLIHTIDLELRSHQELDTLEFQRWVETRHAQIEDGELYCIAHQLDVVGSAPLAVSHSR